ncbi:TetR/AcrR family transcriptional regulator [cf. Phormidesmis sp. LEGE 11477]|uniref:TetR/AcrR family transcriptional regulator n=1 Tax=cf. Phormidesmis sp. LEGE 11477 TaxID=1828680 RepID=UPI00187EB4D0|nr:TetR/AcrR family transcriptional regulator [cf. Phormidesmis sp. LEGE 11477]MBE9063795.1 TetR/AcrR family transcriptional regulator [cf. Phormidesmis sp. LEGE 11477]
MATKLTKAEQTRRTRRAILDRARQLFASQGYAATGTEEIIQELGITRGALYHQFKGGKQAVFEAVVEEAYSEMTTHITSQIHMGEADWEQLVQAALACLELAQQSDLRQIVFIDAPAVLAVETLVQFDQYGFGLLQEAIQRMVKQGQLDVVDAEGFSHVLNGALNELAAWVAQSPDSTRLQTAQDLVKDLLEKHRAM